MALFEKQIELLRKQLGELETSQRMAIFLCGIIVAGSVLMLTRWSLAREMVPLYTDVLSDEEITEISRQLKMMGEHFEEKDGTIWVSPDNRRELVMKMAMSNAGPKSARLTFQDLIKDSKPWASEAKTRWEQNVALQNELAKIIETDKKFRQVSVFIAGEDKRRLLGKGSTPTASVRVDMAAGHKLDKLLVKSLADMVAGAVPRLAAGQVTIVDLGTGRSYVGGDVEEALGTKIYELQRHKEQARQSDIEKMLSYIPRVIVTVRLKLEEQSVSSVETELEKPRVLSEKTEEQSMINQARGMEPGVDANTSVGLSAGGAGSTESVEKTEKTYQQKSGGRVTEMQKNPGTVVQASASIQIPRSYFVGVFRSESGDAQADPAEDQLRSLIADKSDEIRKSVATVLGGEQEPIVEVRTYNDEAMAYTPGSPGLVPEEADNQVMDFVSANGKQIALVALALVAMGMMMHMVRRPGSGPVVPGEAKSASERLAGAMDELLVDSGAIGEAMSPDGFLIAPETDESSIRARHIAQQVAELVDNDPEGAAQLVRRWIEREK